MEDNTQELDWSKAQGVVITVDLVKAAKRQLQFLAAVDSAHCLYDGPALDHAIDRYKYCWLPLLAKHALSPITTEPLVVPLDCEWIWHCHRLNPVQYKIDCEEIYGRILDNQNVLSSIIEGTSMRQTERLWNHMYPTESYHFEQCCQSLMGTNCINMGAQRFKYDLTAAVKRQCSFFNKVSKSIINDDCYLEEAVARYKAFLHLIKRNEERYVKCFCVPTYDIDLIWHSHQLNPLSYCDDLKPIFGKIISHNDHISDSPVDNKHKIGLAQTTKLWEDIFGRKYLITGAMFKSDDKIARCYSIVGFKTCDSQCAEEVTSCAKCFSCGVGFTTYG
ncbi:glycine-rich domain-containing protein 2-like isoform X2 [Punica granatum]|uniref:Glycine-rich domain-containing protein 2-like isoform X2 n=1 Tax=Punica granatum TaxID=22663 RepID=A0A6P8D0P8_PUNGR|nr:glycine-rich domain-containing protein 2-like isoform X2 [Punica granatum]